VEQRIYHGDVTPGELADFLVEQYDPRPRLQAQKLGEGDSLLVQIGHGDEMAKMHDAITVAITRAPDGAAGLALTVGRQQWFSPTMVGYTAMLGLISVMVTPWVLFALIWPITEAVESVALAGDVWSSIDLYLASHGAVRGAARQLTHPHA
jgi:hypothetical protein